MVNSREICRLANRVELSANFAGSAGDPEASQKSFQEAVSTSLVLLNQIDPFWVKEAFASAESEFDSVVELLNSQDGWASYLATKTDLMHQVGIHQKAIERLGTIANQWDRVPPIYQELVNSLETLSCLLNRAEDELFARFFANQQVPNRVFNLSSIFYGLALMASIHESAEPRWNSAISCSSAKIVVENVALLA